MGPVDRLISGNTRASKKRISLESRPSAPGLAHGWSGARSINRRPDTQLRFPLLTAYFIAGSWALLRKPGICLRNRGWPASMTGPNIRSFKRKAAFHIISYSIQA